MMPGISAGPTGRRYMFALSLTCLSGINRPSSLAAMVGLLRLASRLRFFASLIASICAMRSSTQIIA